MPSAGPRFGRAKRDGFVRGHEPREIHAEAAQAGLRRPATLYHDAETISILIDQCEVDDLAMNLRAGIDAEAG